MARAHPLRPAERGFTLVEVLVVLAIIGIAAGATALAIGRGRSGPSAAAEARLLAQRLRLAADESMISDRPLAIAWGTDGYRFVGWDAGAWTGKAPGVLGQMRALPRGLSLESASRSPAAIDVGAAEPLLLRVEGGGANVAVRFDGADASVEGNGADASFGEGPR